MTLAAPETTPRVLALIACAGSGARAGGARPKQYRLLAGQRLVSHTLMAFTGVRRIRSLLVAVAPDDRSLCGAGADWVVAPCGGATRAETVRNGLAALRARGAAADDWVLVHDAARCLVTAGLVDTLIDACLPDPVGGLLALPLPDTLKVARDGRVAGTLERSDKWLAQTPQMFRIGMLQEALERQAGSGFPGVTDEASAIESAGHAPLLVRGSADNIKVTYPEDFVLAEAILRSRAP